MECEKLMRQGQGMVLWYLMILMILPTDTIVIIDMCKIYEGGGNKKMKTTSNLEEGIDIGDY